MAPRLQGVLTPDGVLEISVWGSGEAGWLRVRGLAGPLVVAPNRIETADGAAGLYVAQSAPVIAIRGLRVERARPSGHGGFRVEPRGADTLVAAGADAAEAAAALPLDVASVVQEAAAHVARCDLMPDADPLLRSLVMHGAHASLSSARRDERGRFAGLAAGLIYSNPPRTYFRDGYWTLQLLLRLAPELVAAEIDLLAAGVRPDGEAPSAVILQGPGAEAFEQRRLARPGLAATNKRPREWWSDHFDSPLFFVLMVADYARTTGDDALARRHWPRLAAILHRYQALRGPEGLPVKPHHERDWADNVTRPGLVAYDIGLWIGALDAIARLGARIDPPLAAAAREVVVAARRAADAALWRRNRYADYVRPDGWAETHLALDALMLLRFGAAPEDRALGVLKECRAALESRHNPDQRYGDFGMLSVWPPFADRGAVRAKSAFAYRYHNGGDWPWLDAIYAAERLKRGLPGWRYPLTRWWEICLEHGWAGPVEHYSVPFGRGSLLQGWSSLPAEVVLEFADRVLAGDPERERVG